MTLNALVAIATATATPSPPTSVRPGMFDEHPDAELDVQPPIVERPERPRVALVLFHLFDSAERAPRRMTGLLWGHPLRQESVLEELQVRVDFPCELGLGTAGPEEGHQTMKETTDRNDHDGSSRSFSTRPASRRHFSVCLASSRSPALVMA